MLLPPPFLQGFGAGGFGTDPEAGKSAAQIPEVSAKLLGFKQAFLAIDKSRISQHPRPHGATRMNTLNQKKIGTCRPSNPAVSNSIAVSVFGLESLKVCCLQLPLTPSKAGNPNSESQCYCKFVLTPAFFFFRALEISPQDTRPPYCLQLCRGLSNQIQTKQPASTNVQ